MQIVQTNRTFTFIRGRCKAMIYLQDEIKKFEKSHQPTAILKDQLEKIKKLETYPISSKQLRRVGIIPKAKLLKAHLVDEYSNTIFSVKCSFRSGGTIINVFILDGEDPLGIEKIIDLYMDEGDDPEKKDFDNVIHITDMRGTK